MIDRGVARDVQRERGLPHARARRDDDQLAGLEAARHLVEIVEARRQTRERAGAVHDAFDVVEHAGHLVVDVLERRAALLLRDVEDLRLGEIEQFVGALGLVVAGLDDLGRDADQPPLDRLVAHDARVVRHVRGRGGEIRDLGERDIPAHRIERLLLSQMLGESD